MKTGCLVLFEKQQNVKQSFDVHLTEDQKQKKTDLMSLDPSLLVRMTSQAIITT